VVLLLGVVILRILLIDERERELEGFVVRCLRRPTWTKRGESNMDAWLEGLVVAMRKSV